MAHYHLAVFPVGKLDAQELEHALAPVARLLGHPVELRSAVPTPQGIEETDRKQFRAAALLRALRADTAPVGRGRWIGGEGTPPPGQDAKLCVTDVDLYTAKSDSVFAVLNSQEKIAVVSVRRLRESFYRRPADAEKQRTRLAREMLRMVGRLHGGKECPTPTCLLSQSRVVSDIDLKEDQFCRACAQRIFQGKMHV